MRIIVCNIFVRNVCILTKDNGDAKMTKARYMYELIDKCMVIFCQDNILIENFDLSDDCEFYKMIESQFMSCMKFYDDMKQLVDRKEMDEAMMDHELRTVLNLIRQKALNGLLQDFVIFLERTGVPNKKEQIALLKGELQRKAIDAEFLLNKLMTFRIMEQEIH